jgi:hypothetical protein
MWNNRKLLAIALLVLSCLTGRVCLGGATGFVFKRATIGLCEDTDYIPEEPISYSIDDFNGLLVCFASIHPVSLSPCGR